MIKRIIQLLNKALAVADIVFGLVAILLFMGSIGEFLIVIFAGPLKREQSLLSGSICLLLAIASSWFAKRIAKSVKKSTAKMESEKTS